MPPSPLVRMGRHIATECWVGRPITPFCAGPGEAGGPGDDEGGGDAGSAALAAHEEEPQPDLKPEPQPEQESPHSREVGPQHFHPLPMIEELAGHNFMSRKLSLRLSFTSARCVLADATWPALRTYHRYCAMCVKSSAAALSRLASEGVAATVGGALGPNALQGASGRRQRAAQRYRRRRRAEQKGSGKSAYVAHA